MIDQIPDLSPAHRADSINRSHRNEDPMEDGEQVPTIMAGCVRDAIAIGEFLARKKAELGDGYNLWFDASISFSRKTGGQYVNLWESRDSLLGVEEITEAFARLVTISFG